MSERWRSRPKNALAGVAEYEKFVVNAVTLIVSPREPLTLLRDYVMVMHHVHTLNI